MPLSLTLPVRSWAALDAALTFFRSAPFEMAAACRLARHCRRLHRLLRRAGVRGRYVRVALLGPGRCLLRLHLAGDHDANQELALDLPRRMAKSLAEACLAIIEVHSDVAAGALLDHEAEELHAARTFLSELRRQGQCCLAITPACYAHEQLHWDDRRREFGFTDQVGERVRQHYLHVGAAVN